MRRKLVGSLVALLLVFAAGAVIVDRLVRQTERALRHVADLHEIERLRQGLALEVRKAQSEVHVSRSGPVGIEALVSQARALQASASTCAGCHHTPQVARELSNMRALLAAYQQSLSDYVTVSAGPRRIEALRVEADVLGDRLVESTEGMSRVAAENLQTLTEPALLAAESVRRAILITLALALLFGVLISVRLTNAVGRPIASLVEAADRLGAGEVGYQIGDLGEAEFGRLARRFNDMSRSLKESYGRLEESEGFLRAVVDSVQDPFIVFDHGCRVVRLNTAYADLQGQPVQAVLGQSCREVFGPTAEDEGCVVERTLKSGTPDRMDLSVRLGGRDVWLEVHTYPVINDEGRVTHVIAASRDVTERVAAAAALSKSNERYELAARGANDGLWDWDLDSNQAYYSARWRALLGLEEHELTADIEDWLGRVHPDDVGRLRQSLFAHARGETSQFQEEYRIGHRDGRWRWMNSRGLAIRDAEGKIRRMSGSQSDIGKQKAVEEQLLHNALHDPLTGLANRLLLKERLNQAAARASRRTDYLFGVLFLDLDGFKGVNDTLGHGVGDQLLAQVAERLKSSIRAVDTVGRIGGDEFVIILDDIESPEAAAHAGDRVQRALAAHFVVADQEIATTASIGVVLSSSGFQTPEDLLRFADIAMYRAKIKGEGSIVLFDPSADEATLRHLELEAGLRTAIERGELRLHYQPILALDSGRVAGLEALLRWAHPKLGLLSPDAFLSLAERRGLIVPIGYWVLREAFVQMRSLQKLLPKGAPEFVSINVSARQLAEPDLVARVHSLLDECGLDPGSVMIEVTETAFMGNLETATVRLSQLRELGARICLDDFGTGYSSLGYLGQFPIGTLKIDRSFVRQLGSDGKAHEIIGVLVALAKKLKVEVVAEGIETPLQMEEAQNLCCEFGQGNLLSMPLAFEELTALLLDRQGEAFREPPAGEDKARAPAAE